MYSPFERLPILPQANEQDKHNEVCLTVLLLEQLEKMEENAAFINEFNWTGLGACALCIASVIYF